MKDIPQRRYWLILWVFAVVAANAALPRVLAGAARGAARRDEQDCHQQQHTLVNA